jgi:hypothetical protein
MSGLLLPKRLQGVATAEAISKTAVHRLDSDDFLAPQDVKDQLAQLQGYLDLRREDQANYTLPSPSGWKISILLLTIPDKSAGGVFVMDDSKEQRALSSPQGVILGMGPAAYTDADRFSVDGNVVPWHEVGDRITLIKYDASTFQIANGQRLGFLNDTQPVATIDTGWEIPC